MHVKKMMADIGSHFFPWPKSGKNVQVACRPIQLWEIVMPRESLHDVMRMIWNGQNPQNEHGWKEWMGSGMLRKALKLDPVPTFDEKIPRRQIFNQDITSVPIGVKDDINHEGPEYL